LADVFEEVEGQLRVERYRSLGRRLLPWLIGAALLALLISLALFGWREWRERAAEQASVQYSAGLEALQAGDRAKADQSFAAAAQSRSGAYRSLALMQRAGIKVAENKPREAVPLLDQAADAAPGALMADAAALKAAFLVMDYAPLADIENRLEPLRKEGRPYRSVAREAWAMAQVGAGKGADARQEFVVLSQGLDTSETARARAQAMIAAIDSGAAAQTPAILRAPQVAESAPVQPQAPAPQP
jgi:hypothetical protein